MPNTEPFARSTPYTEKRVTVIYILLFIAVVISTVVFTVKGTMDALQVALTIATMACVLGGMYNNYRCRKDVLLFDDCFTVGGQRFEYGAIRKIECVRNAQIIFTTGKGMADKHNVLVGNGDALMYLINRKRKEYWKNQKNG